jgi:hypothetical protein
MTEQEIFDTVVRHLKKQGRRAVDRGQCVYRHPEGLKCAVGCLISDAEYYPRMEGQPVYDITLPDRLAGHRRLLSYLQDSHDAALDMANLWQRFRETAALFKLNPAVLDEEQDG